MRKLKVSADSTTGLRDRNEDSYLVNNRARFYAVADGIGGLPFGNYASRLAVTATIVALNKPKLPPPKELTRRVFEQVSTSFTQHISNGMGTTLVTISFNCSKRYAVVGNVGDSRAYLLREEKIVQLTTDQNIGGTLTGAIATSRSTKPDLIEIDVMIGDTFLLCSDGVSNELSRGLIQQIIMEKAVAATTARRLVKATYTEGEGNDNATAVVIRVGEHVAKSSKS